MARLRPAQSVKLFAGLLGGDIDLLRRARQRLSRLFGPIDLESDIWVFDQTDYYHDEMGPDLRRWFISFAEPAFPDQLVAIKHETNKLEQEIAADCLSPEIARPVNIDPGYVDLNKVVLATTKDRAHRIYLTRGIYAEVTLQFSEGGWQVQPWTYADYRQRQYHEYFTRLRGQLRHGRRQREEFCPPEPADQP